MEKTPYKKIFKKKVKKNFFLGEQFNDNCSLINEKNNYIERNAKFINKKVHFLKFIVK